MKPPVGKNVPAPVRERLYQLALQRKEDFGVVLTRYALERLLYRLSESPHREVLILKGAMLFHAWTDFPHRPTRDLDLLGLGDPNEPRCQEILKTVCARPDARDGLTFQGKLLRSAIHGTFARGRTVWSLDALITVLHEMGIDARKGQQWRASSLRGELLQLRILQSLSA